MSIIASSARPRRTTPRIESRVVCGVGETMVSCCSSAALSSVLLPTFGRPIRAMRPDREGPSIDAGRIGLRGVGGCATPVRCSARGGGGGGAAALAAATAFAARRSWRLSARLAWPCRTSGAAGDRSARGIDRSPRGADRSPRGADRSASERPRSAGLGRGFGVATACPGPAAPVGAGRVRRRLGSDRLASTAGRTSRCQRFLQTGSGGGRRARGKHGRSCFVNRHGGPRGRFAFAAMSCGLIDPRARLLARDRRDDRA